MSYELLVGSEGKETEAYYLGTTQDISDFSEWVAGLPPADFPRLHRLAEDFETREGTAVATEIGRALESHPPAVEGVTATATEIADTTFGLDDGVLVWIAS